MPRSTPSHSSPSRSPSMNTRSRAQAYIKTEAESPDVRRQEQAVEKEQAAAIKPTRDRDHLHDQEERLSMLPPPTTPEAASPTMDITLSSIDTNQQVDHVGERSEAAVAHSSKQDHAADASHQESAEHVGKLAMKAHQESTEMRVVPQMESTVKERVKAMEDNESNMQQSRPNQEVVKKIIRVNDGDEHQERNKAKDPWILKRPFPPYTKEGHHVKGGHHHASDQGGQVSTRMQSLKRSASMIMSQVNERVFKRLRKVPSCRLHYRPSLHVSIALLMCAICATAIGAASYWYHLKKLEEAQMRAQKRWLW